MTVGRELPGAGSGPVCLEDAHRLTPIKSWTDTLDCTEAEGISSNDRIWFLHRVQVDMIDCRGILALDDPDEVARLEPMAAALVEQGDAAALPPLVLEHSLRNDGLNLHLYDGVHRAEAAIMANFPELLAWVAHRKSCCTLAAG